jgi:hypothetical protein
MSRRYQRVACPNCQRQVALNAMGLHRRGCRGLPAPDRTPNGRPFNGHVHCGCGNIMRGDAPRCFKCEQKDPVFALLDALIKQGIQTPRAKLEEVITNGLLQP